MVRHALRDPGTRHIRRSGRTLSPLDWVLQVLYVVLVGAILYYMLFYSPEGAKQGGVESFDVLGDVAGWSIPTSFIPLESTSPYWLLLLSGLLNTVVLAAVSLSVASLVGLLVGIARTTSNALVRLLGVTYVEVFRNVPEILVCLFVYQIILHLPTIRQAFATPHIAAITNRGAFLPGLNTSRSAVVVALVALILAVVILVWLTCSRHVRHWTTAARRAAIASVLVAGLGACTASLWLGHPAGQPLISLPELHRFRVEGGITISSSMLAMIIGIGLFGGAYIGEIARAGFQAVPQGQIEAARTLGLSAWHVLTRIRVPYAFRIVLPTLTSQYVWLLKATTMGIAVGYADFFMVVLQSLTQAGHTIAFIAALIIGFLAINLTLAGALNYLNGRLAFKGRS